MALIETLQEFESYLREIRAPIIEKLQPGLPIERIQELVGPYNVHSREFEILFEWKDGAANPFDAPVEQLELIPSICMMPLETSIEYYNGYEYSWHKKFFPVFDDGGGCFYLIKRDNADTRVYLFSPSVFFTDRPVSMYSSVESLFRTSIELFRAGIYYINADGYFEIGDQDRGEIGKALNHDCKFWTM
ncbi:MAG: hypothetical protein EOO89_31430 [Pedobacter sp.]|nr:MAG: hypothetical protein EOO89_31430 [Pedobacter sp.]